MKKFTLIAASLLFASAGFSQVDTFFFTGAVQTYTVPVCATSITIDISGGQGGSIANLSVAPTSALGGLGGRVQATIPVTGGSVLQINVGGKGMSDNLTLSCQTSTGGFNGGGIGYGGYNSYNYNAGGGGGASDIRVSPYNLSNVLAVAGGGGGAACTGCTGGGVIGGAGGGLTGGDGSGGTCSTSKDYGHGGTQLKGGDSGTYWGNGTSGTLGMGGTAPSCCAVTCGGGGGGGGGYYGGGGGSLAGGGGGSSYTIAGATGVTHTQGYKNGNGIVIITPNISTGISLSASQTHSTCSANNTGKATASVSGGTPPFTYLWKPSGGSGPVATGLSAGTYTCTVTDSSGCKDSAVVAVTVDSLSVMLSAAKDTLCLGVTSDALTGTPIGGTYSGAGVTGNNFNSSTAGVGSHVVKYTYADTNGCADSALVTIVVQNCTGVNEVISLDKEVQLYPNPFSESISVNVAIGGTVTVTMFNILGESVGAWNVAKGQNIINTKLIPSGIYFIQIKTKDGVLNKKLVKGN